MTAFIGRREFITLVGGAAAAWPVAARAEQPAIPVLGFMSARTPEDSVRELEAFQRGLGEDGSVIEGRNVIIEYRWARGDYGRLPAFAAELVQRAKSRTSGRNLRSTGTKARTHVDPLRASNTDLEKRLAEALQRQTATSEAAGHLEFARRAGTCVPGDVGVVASHQPKRLREPMGQQRQMP